MLIEPRIRRFLEEALDSDHTPDEVCRDCPDLLEEVRRQLERVRAVEAEMDALFPSPDVPPPDDAAFRDEETGLPRIEGYDVEAVVGRGGMGIVYRARHRKLNRPVALKTILAGAYASPQDRTRFQREAEAVAALRHPNVVQVFDSGEAGGRPYFTMELVEGGNLAEKVAGTPLSARPAAHLVATIAGAVHAAHANGIVHRDLKPANVLLTADGTPKVSDFGLARHVESGPELTLSGTRVGTPNYMAPEQALGRSRAIGPETDVYALGAILYELLTGRPPFKGESAAETERQVIANDPVPPSRLNAGVPRDLEIVCLKCLHKVPRRRYASAAELKEDLGCFLAGEAISARPEWWLERQARCARRRPVLATLLAAGAILCAIASSASWWYFTERAAAAREAQAGWAATERAADEDLQEMVRWLNQSSWPEARAARERARGRLGERGSAELRRRMDQGESDLELAARLEKIPVDRAYNSLNATAYRSDGPYEEAFRAAGLGQVTDAPEAVAARVRESDIRRALVAALDHWSGLPRDPGRRRWVLGVARLADTDPDPTGWRARARDPNVREDPAALAEVIAEVNTAARAADQPVQLLLALDKRLTFDSPERLPFLRRVQQAHPGDFWGNYTLGEVLCFLVRPPQRAEGIRYYQAAVALRPQVVIANVRLATVLTFVGRMEEGIDWFRRAAAVDPASVVAHLGLAHPLWSWGRYDEAIDHYDAAVRLEPNNAQTRLSLGRCLEVRGRHDDALDQYRRAAALDPQGPLGPIARSELRAALTRRGLGEEARVAWEKEIAEDPAKHDAWYGYAEFCLFLGREDEYRRARRALLDKFGATSDRYVAARTARACLLLPGTEDELREAAALAEHVAAVESGKNTTSDSFFQFARGLADYRQRRLDPAIATMRGKAFRMNGPAPGLVLALALQRSGRVEEARKELAAAVMAYHWRATGALNQEQWVLHVLRREAEAAILPDLPAFLDGKYQPRDNDERLALLGVCQFTNRSHALAHLYTDAFAAAPSLAEDFRSGLRSSAARAAALVGCGRGKDAAGVTGPERARWRQQARQWLRADLAAWNQALDRDPATARSLWPISMWPSEPDFAGFFEPAEVDKLPPDERKDCAALSKEIADFLSRALSASPRIQQ